MVVLLLLLLQEVFPGGTFPAYAQAQISRSPSSPPSIVCSAADGIFAVFQSHPLVGLSDYHGLAQEEDFFTALVRDKRFAKDVGNVVVEFGDAAQQNTLDRYLAGEDVPYEQLRRVWSDVIGWNPIVTAMGYINFYAQVRALNLALPPEQRIHVWLGDPPVDWSQIKTKEDLAPHLNQRDQYPAEILKTEILAKNKKALVIYGGFHLHGSLRDQVNRIQPGAFFVVTPYTGYDEGLCSGCFEKAARNWPQPAFATSPRDSSLPYELLAQGCNVLSSAAIGPANAVADIEERLSGGTADALLYLGPAANLTRSPESADLVLDLRFRAEIDRRVFLETGAHLPQAGLSPVSPQYFHTPNDNDGSPSQ